MLRQARVYCTILAKTLPWIVLVVGIGAGAWCSTHSLKDCVVQDFEEGQKLAFNMSNEIVKLLLTLSTTLVAFGGAVALGLIEAPKLNADSRVLVLASTWCFAFSAYFALLWQSRLAQLYYLGCPKVIAQPPLETPFTAHTYFFLFGLVLIGIATLLATFGGSRGTVPNGERG